MVVTAQWVGLSPQGPGLRVGTRTLHKGPACCQDGNAKAWPAVVPPRGVGSLRLSPPPPPHGVIGARFPLEVFLREWHPVISVSED